MAVHFWVGSTESRLLELIFQGLESETHHLWVSRWMSSIKQSFSSHITSRAGITSMYHRAQVFYMSCGTGKAGTADMREWFTLFLSSLRIIYSSHQGHGLFQSSAFALGSASGLRSVRVTLLRSIQADLDIWWGSIPRENIFVFLHMLLFVSYS